MSFKEGVRRKQLAANMASLSADTSISSLKKVSPRNNVTTAPCRPCVSHGKAGFDVAIGGGGGGEWGRMGRAGAEGAAP